ncbi:helix-turn-helix domain-containing protein [Methylobacter tundripaludum]|uniref:helix-turn-helix domain-containing protein n=1 Tax=Methylobacter tundripaludum TaxID=173365 RepID=UPI000690C6ED|nr:helix-turn-helix domain-containing protein [Methylobacter tundripaludum]
MNQEQNLVNLDAVIELNPIGDKVLEQTASQLFFIPFMTPDKFAESIGLSKGVVGGWIDQGYLPTAKIGRYRMINMVVLVANLKEGKVL